MASVKISALALMVAANMTAVDIVPMTDADAGTPTTYKTTFAQLRTTLFQAAGAGWTATDYILIGGGADPGSGVLRIAQGALAGASSPMLNSTVTWNNAATTFTHQLITITDTNSNAASLIADWKVGATSMFKVTKAGAATVQGLLTVVGNAGLPAAAGSALYFAGGFGGSVSGKIYVGDGSGWSVQFTKRTASADTALLTITDAGTTTFTGTIVPTSGQWAKLIAAAQGTYGSSQYQEWFRANGVTAKAEFGFTGGDDATLKMSTSDASGSIVLSTGNKVAALTLNNAQAATFASTIAATTGTFTSASTTINLDANQGSAGQWAHIKGMRASSGKYWIGLNGSDIFTVFDAAGTAENFTLSNAGAGTFRAGITATAGTFSGTVTAGGFTANVSSGSFIAQDSGGTAVQIQCRPNSGKSGWVTFTENTIADRWIVGIKNGDAALYFGTGNPGSFTDQMKLTSNGDLELAADKKYIMNGVGGAANSYIRRGNGAGAIEIVFDGSQSATFSGSAVAVVSGTTASGANVQQGASLGNLNRSTSSIRFKKNIAAITLEEARHILHRARPISFNSRCEGDPTDIRYIGLVAEEMALVDDRFVTWDEKKRPLSVQYDRLVAPLLVIAQDHESRLAALERWQTEIAAAA